MDPKERPKTAAVLAEWRTKRRLRVHKLAELSDVSATYIRLIEAGIDDEDRQVVPSASVIQKLARGLAKTEGIESARAEEERRIYAELMAAAGYLDATLYPQAPSPQAASSARERSAAEEPKRAVGACPERVEGNDPAAFSLASAARFPERCAAPDEGIVELKDPRLKRYGHELLARWDAYSSEDQALVLGIFEFVVERRRRREGLS